MTPAMHTADVHPVDPRTGFELGWDHAHHGLDPAAELLATSAPVREGWQAGRASFGPRTLQLNPLVQQWLDLRTSAWLRARHFDTLAVTPSYLAQISGRHCPVTREHLQAADGPALPQQALIERVCEDAGYAAGNLAMLSRRAATAKADLGHDEAFDQMRRIDAQGLGTLDGLNALQWARLAVLLSLVTPLSHERAASLPLLVLPPNRLHLINPIQGVQALLTLQLLRSGWSQRIPAFEALLPTAALRRELRTFFSVLLPKVLMGGRPEDAQAWRWALEDAWRHPKVQQQWRRFALQLSAEQAQALLDQAVKQGLCAQRARALSSEEATAGWQLSTRGYAEPQPARPSVHHSTGWQRLMRSVMALDPDSCHTLPTLPLLRPGWTSTFLPGRRATI